MQVTPNTPAPTPTPGPEYYQSVPFAVYVETIATTTASKYNVASSIACTPSGVFARGQRIVFRFEIIDTATGKRLTSVDGYLALGRGDIGFVTTRLEGTAYSCKPTDVPPAGLGGPACDYVGQQFDAFPINHLASEGGKYPIESATRELSQLKDDGEPTAIDAFGDGNPCVYALSALPGEYKTVLTALITRPANYAGSGPLRVVEVVTWRFEGTQWNAVGLLSASVFAEELLHRSPLSDTNVPGWEKLAP